MSKGKNGYVEQWYEHLRSLPSLTEEDSDVLKNHLLDSIDRLNASGLNEEEAFTIASQFIYKRQRTSAKIKKIKYP